MNKRSALLALLEEETEPTPKHYNEIIEEVMRCPPLISGLSEETVRDETLIHLTTQHNRLANFFLRLRPVQQQMFKSTSASKIATESVKLLTDILPNLHQLLEDTKVLDLLVPALDVCLLPSRRPALHELASVLAKSGTLLESLASDDIGVEIIRQWVSMESTIALDAETLSVWTERLVSMVSSCAIDHDIANDIQHWHMLQTLKNSLQSMTPRASDTQHTAISQLDLPPLGSMLQLRKEDKKSRLVKHQETTNTIPSFQDVDKHYLKAFNIHVPGSKSSLLDVIKRLEGEKTTAILLSIALRLPCYLCVSSLGSAPPVSKSGTHNESFEPVPIPQIEILDKGVGIWKVLLSPQALKSLLHLGSHGVVDSTIEKLHSIASGCWDPKDQPLAGSKHQRKCLKVPVAKTECGQNQFILWQIAIGMDVEMDVSQQQIIVWEVCDYGEISKIVDRVIFLQQSYSDDTVSRCRKHCPAVNRMQSPARFEETSSDVVIVSRPSGHLDVRTVDQDIIEMTNKFYVLTEPVIRSILSGNLSAEFPFDLSKEEAGVIRHFRTASLILGRSGTGKTTCLVFKLVGKYLASRAVADEKPVRQALLTRSEFLADKLSSYTRQLIKTLLSKSADLDSSQPSEHRLSTMTRDGLQKCTVFELKDTSFPLVCTWENFLGILENTAKKYDSRRSHRLEEPASDRSDEITATRRSIYGQVVDFDSFKSDYWPQLSHTLTKGLSVHLVFAEIMGVIKGSVSSRESLEPLDREFYLTRSSRLAPTFVLETERSRVYEIFKMYEKLKLELGGVDYVDRVVKLIRAVRRDSSLNQLLQFTFDEVYIDEIQDQRCLDVELLLNFIRDGRGFHFAGDTAQAISQESTFRFSEIKALFYEHFAAASAATNQAELSRPHMFTLSKNYRSHEGILALASLVMGMIWKGFPETVDKLDPEIGHLNGPKPVLFWGIDSVILRSKDVGHAMHSSGIAQLGAEQVILVRDAQMKSSLNDQLGDAALVLTILESKGMEFDDVILWNFFTECPDQAGVRSLETLEKEPALFDPKRHSGMCSELKNLYVAITRARVQLFIMESSGTTATTVLKVLSSDASGSLVHVTSPTCEDFAMRLEMLRPGTSLNPKQWSQRGAEFMQRRMYKDALGCYRNAQDVGGVTTAEGHLLEDAARECLAKNNMEGFTRNLTLAKERFLQENLFNDAARVLVGLGKPEDAAEVFILDKNYSKAARLYVESNLNTKAIDLYHLAGEYSEAAAILNKERDYDQLVFYLDENRENIPTNVLRGYSLLCKLLLKQSKVSTERRKHAIRLLGSLADQEKCFLEYQMDEELAELYASQLRYLDLVRLYSRKGQLEQAISLAITKDLLHTTEVGMETEILNLLDFVWAGRMQKHRAQQIPVPFKLPAGFATPELVLRAEQWEACSKNFNLEGYVVRQNIASMSNNVPKTVLCLRKILNATTITSAVDLDDLPFEMMQETIEFTKSLILNKDDKALNILLLLAGLWRPAKDKEHLMVLPWSPLREIFSNVSNTSLTNVAIQRVLDGLVSAILALDTRARILWKKKWPIRCVQFISKGFCPRERKGEPCNRVHRVVSEQECSQIAEDLLLVNGVLCDLAAIFYRRILNETFQEKYLGIKRYWLERFLRELIYLSAMEQHASTIRKTHAKLSGEKKYIAVSSFLEQLLYHRLGNEWHKRSNFTSLLEQMQLAKILGPHVQNRLFRALSHRLFLDQRPLMQRHLSLLSMLEENISCRNASFFQAKLTTFLSNLDNIEVPALSTLHSLTAVVEFLAVHLILRTCVTACVIPGSWIDLHITSTSKTGNLSELVQGDDRYRYLGCLTQLTKSFCHILSRIDKAALPTDFFLCNGSFHPSLLLRERNAELLAILVVNLAATSPEPPTGFNEAWARAKEVFEYESIKAFHLKGLTTNELTQKLAPLLTRHGEKDALVLVIRDRVRGSPFYSLERQLGVRTVLYDQICPPVPTSAAADDITIQTAHSISEEDADGLVDQYSAEETDAMIKLQRLWRRVCVKLRNRRSYVSVPECRATAQFFNLGAHCPDTMDSGDRKAVRRLLPSLGVVLLLRLDAAKDLLDKLQEDIMTCIENVEISQGVDKSVDDILCRNADVEVKLREAREKMSDECLVGLVRQGVRSMLENNLKDVEGVVVEAEQSMLETRKMVDGVSHSCTK